MDEVVAVLEEEASQRIEFYDGEPPLSQTDIETRTDSGPANEEDIYTAGEELMDIYDSLFDVETDLETREDFKENFVYDPNMKSLMKPEASPNSAILYGAAAGTGLLLSVADPANTGIYAVASLALGQSYNYRMNKSLADASYDDKTSKIGISLEKESLVDAVDVLSAELVHAYQDEFDSVTWGEKDLLSSIDPRTPAIREGFERATRIKALETLASDDFMDEDWKKLAHKRKTSAVVNGYIQAKEELNGTGTETAKDLGLSKDSSETALENISSTESTKYDLVASVILGNEIIRGEDIFNELFNGEIDIEEVLIGTP